MLSDYNCKILNIDRFKLHLGDEIVLKNEFQKMIDDINLLGSLGFHKLVCQTRYNHYIPTSNVKQSILALKRRIQKEVAHRLSGKFNISVVPTICLSSDTPYIKNLRALTLPKTNYIFLELPFSEMSEHMHTAINKILYTQKLLPVFTEFHIYSSFYEADDINKLINIKGAAFQFSLKHSVLPKNIKIIKQILRNGNTVLIGTSCDHSQLNKSDLLKNINLMKKLLGEDFYMTLVLRARAFAS